MYPKFSDVIKATEDKDFRISICIMNVPDLLLLCILYRHGLYNVPRVNMLDEMEKTVFKAAMGEFDHIFSDKKPMFIPNSKYLTKEIGLFRHFNDRYNEYGPEIELDSSLRTMIVRFLDFGCVEIGHIMSNNMFKAMAMGEERRIRDTLKLRESQWSNKEISEDSFQKSTKRGLELIEFFDYMVGVSEDIHEMIIKDKYFLDLLNKIGEDGFTSNNSTRTKHIVKIEEYVYKLFLGLMTYQGSNSISYRSDLMQRGIVDTKWVATAASRMLEAFRMCAYSGFFIDSFASINETFEVWTDLWENIQLNPTSLGVALDLRDKGHISQGTLLAELARSSPLVSICEEPGAAYMRDVMRERSFTRSIFGGDVDEDSDEIRAAKREESERKFREKRIESNPLYAAFVKYAESVGAVLHNCTASGGGGIDESFFDYGFIVNTKEYVKRQSDKLEAELSQNDGIEYAMSAPIDRVFSSEDNGQQMRRIEYEYGKKHDCVRFLRGLRNARYVYCLLMQYATMNASERIQSGLHPDFYPKDEQGEKIPGMIGQAPQKYMTNHVNFMCEDAAKRLSNPRMRLMQVLQNRANSDHKRLSDISVSLQEVLF